MTKRIGMMAVSIAVGLVVTGILLYQDEKIGSRGSEDNPSDKKNGLFAEICGNQVRTYEVRDGSFCGYSKLRTFENFDKALEWAVKETGLRLLSKDQQKNKIIMNLSLKNERSGFRKENGLRETAGSEEIRDLESDCLYMQDPNCKKKSGNDYSLLIKIP